MYNSELRALLQSAEDESKTVDERDKARLQARNSILFKFLKEFDRARKGTFGDKCRIRKTLPGQRTYPVYHNTNAFARTSKDKFNTFKNTLILNYYTYIKTHQIPYGFIYEGIEIIDNYGRDLISHERNKISDLLLNCTCETIDSNKPGQIDDEDILNAMTKIPKFNKIGILTSLDQVQKLIFSKIYGEPLIIRSTKIPSDTLILFDLEMLYIFEQNPRIKLHPIPHMDTWGATVIKKYFPAIMDMNSIIKIIIG